MMRNAVEILEEILEILPDWGKYREENSRLMMPMSVRLNHAIADGFLVADERIKRK